MIRLFSLFFVAPVHIYNRRKKSSTPFSFEKCAVKISVARMRAPMTFKFGEVASFVVKDNSYHALPSASTANENRLF